MSGVAYNPSDPVQAQFLSSLALGESGTNGTSQTGFGGGDLSGSPTDQYGFPIWSGSSTSAGATHAAGTFQFEPGTWDAVAAAHGLNFSNPADQAAGAWYLAQDTYAAKTGGSLEGALQSGDKSSLSDVQSALQSIWPSVGGSGAAPQGLANDIMARIGATIGGALGRGNAFGMQQPAASGGGVVAGIEQFFVRFGLIILGGVIIIVALWQLLSNTGAVPSPGETVKSVGEAVAI